MKHCLLLLGIVAALGIGAPAYSQNIRFDIDSDGDCDEFDVITSSTTSADVWLHTGADADGTPETCPDGTHTNNMFGYAVIIHAGGAGSITYTGWTNAIASFNVNLDAARESGSDFSISWYAPAGTVLAEGNHKLGSIGFTATGNPTLSFLTDNASLGGGAPVTGFATDCDGTDFPNTMALGTNFEDACATSGPTPVESTTWGRIKNLYR